MKQCRYIIGITGGIGSGKSTVSNIIKNFYPLIDADEISRKVVEKGEKGYIRVVEHFGEGILKKDRTIDREKLGKIIFTDDKEKKSLNNILHPIIIEYMKKEINKYKGIVFLDIPLLIESLDSLEKEGIKFNELWLIYIPYDIQLERLRKRDKISKEEASLKIQAQLPMDEKIPYASLVIDNSGSLEQLEKLVLKEIKNLE